MIETRSYWIAYKKLFKRYRLVQADSIKIKESKVLLVLN
jgi:hypothetical protein